MKISRSIAGLCLTTLLAACGGGGGSGSTAAVTSAEGVYGGSITGSAATAFQMLVLENGQYWTMYGTQSSTHFSVFGFIQGNGTASGSSFTSSDAKDFGLTPALAGTVNATFDSAAKTIAGTVKAGAQTTTFTGGPIAGSQYNYAVAASLTNIAGAWSVTSTSGETVSVNVLAGGTFTAFGSSGCNFSGTITPRTSGKNVFNTTMIFGPAPCGLPNQTASGIALSYPLANGTTQLILAQFDSTRTYGSAAFGTR